MQNPHFTIQAMVPVRAQASDSSEMVSQLLFGEVVDVLLSDRQWLLIRSTMDSYSGWIDEKMVLAVDVPWLERVVEWRFVLAPCLELQVERQGTSLPIHLSLGARVPRFSKEAGTRLKIEIGDWSMELPSDKVGSAHSANIHEILNVSEKYLGAPYLWGGRSVWGIDCSGFTQMVFGLCQTALPRDAAQQALIGAEVKFEDRKAGDLAFFANAVGKVIHVGLILPNGDIRHASGHIHDSQLNHTGIVGKYTQKQTHTLCRIKRIV